MSKVTQSIALKWGTIKGWNNLSPDTLAVLQSYAELGMSMSAALRKDTLEQKKILCDLVNAISDVGGEIWNDWDGKLMDRESAKKYIMEYDN